MRHLTVIASLAILALSLSSAQSATALEDFETPNDHWAFANGGEFPGAKGSFVRTGDAAHSGKFGGRLNFDFTGGGNYVAAMLHMPVAPAGSENALQLWLKRPLGNGVVLRYTDTNGQTFMKPVECADSRWTLVTIPFTDWSGHWGGLNDGKVRGNPRSLDLLIEHGEQLTGTFDFDDLRLVNGDDQIAHLTYPAYQFDAAEHWWSHTDGNGGDTRLEGKKWTLDFSQGANSAALTVADRVLVGSVEKIRLRAKGEARGHPVALILHTHFMTFQKVIGEFAGNAELVTDGPPGPGWTWHSGENDGKIHGPLRLTEIRVARNGQNDRCTLELQDLQIDGVCPTNKKCLLVAETEESNGQPWAVATVKGMSDKPLSGDLVWTFRNWDGQEMANGRKAVTVPAMVSPVQVKLPLPKLQDLNFLETEFSLQIPDQETAPAQTVWLAPLQNKGDTVLNPESPFGMGVYLCRYGGDAHGLATMEHAAELARDAGVKWSREDFSWERLEPRRGEFDWTYYDNLVACAKRNGITVYAIAGYWTSWTKPYTPEGIDDYIHYLQTIVRRYQKDIKQWEIWNEPNIFFWQGPKEMYAELLKRSYAAIKEVDPQAQVLGLSTAGIDLKFIDQMQALNAPFDILTIHPYRDVLRDGEFIGDLKQVAQKVRLPDGRKRPVWLTEMGWATFTPHNTLRQDFRPTSLRAQAELIARSYLCAIGSGVEPRTFWYDFRNDGNDPVYFEHQMGIVYNDFRPKPAFQAYATLTRVLKDKTLAGPVDLGPDTFAFKFKPTEGSGENVIAIWNPTKDISVAIPSESKTAIRINAVGERSALSNTSGHFQADLRKGAPVYVVLP